MIWECRAELNVKVQFGATTVNCEGYQHPDDPYILAGSCSLEFTLDWNPVLLSIVIIVDIIREVRVLETMHCDLRHGQKFISTHANEQLASD